jgi:hypothetical protein
LAITAQDLISASSTGTEKARFELLMRRWRENLLNARIVNGTLAQQKAFVNSWLADFEEIFKGQQAKINLLSGYTGFITASVGEDLIETSIDAFLAQYRSTVTALTSKDIVQATGLRNSLALRISREGVANIFKSFDAYDKEARALGLTGRERINGFLNTLGKNYTTIQTISDSGRVMYWKPDKYARMYSNTRDSQLRDDLFQDQLMELGRDTVQISDHDTETPICKQFEGKFFSLTGQGSLPPLTQRPPFHPNCKHVLVSRPRVSNKEARKNNFIKNKKIVEKSSTYTDAQKRQIKRQTAWNVENRPAIALQA